MNRVMIYCICGVLFISAIAFQLLYPYWRDKGWFGYVIINQNEGSIDGYEMELVAVMKNGLIVHQENFAWNDPKERDSLLLESKKGCQHFIEEKSFNK